jgi:hypothetical protein
MKRPPDSAATTVIDPEQPLLRREAAIREGLGAASGHMFKVPFPDRSGAPHPSRPDVMEAATIGGLFVSVIAGIAWSGPLEFNCGPANFSKPTIVDNDYWPVSVADRQIWIA